MKHFSFLLLLIGMITVTFDTHCMLLALRNTKRLQLPQQKRFCSYPTSLEYRMNSLENTVKLHANELAEIKAIVGRWNNNNQIAHVLPVHDPLLDPTIHNSFIDEHNMHYGNTTH